MLLNCFDVLKLGVCFVSFLSDSFRGGRCGFREVLG